MINRKWTGNNIIRILTVLLLSGMLCFCMSACGDESNTEETIEITTPSEETEPADTEETSGDTEKDKGESGDAVKKDSDKSDKEDATGYKGIYKDYDAQMKEAKDKYINELKKKSGSVSKSDLYDETQDRIDKLKEIYDEGKDKMVDAMLASTEDDVNEYEKYFKKMTEAYTEYSRELTSVYTEAF